MTDGDECVLEVRHLNETPYQSHPLNEYSKTENSCTFEFCSNGVPIFLISHCRAPDGACVSNPIQRDTVSTNKRWACFLFCFVLIIKRPLKMIVWGRILIWGTHLRGRVCRQPFRPWMRSAVELNVLFALRVSPSVLLSWVQLTVCIFEQNYRVFPPNPLTWMLALKILRMTRFPFVRNNSPLWSSDNNSVRLGKI